MPHSSFLGRNLLLAFGHTASCLGSRTPLLAASDLVPQTYSAACCRGTAQLSFDVDQGCLLGTALKCKSAVQRLR